MLSFPKYGTMKTQDTLVKAPSKSFSAVYKTREVRTKAPHNLFFRSLAGLKHRIEKAKLQQVSNFKQVTLDPLEESSLKRKVPLPKSAAKKPKFAQITMSSFLEITNST